MIKNKTETITNICTLPIRFNEADPMGVVWHGNYLQYFEDGREAFGAEFGFSYLTIASHGFYLPVVKCLSEYKASLRYGDRVRVETSYIPTLAAKVIFKYRLFREADDILVATGETIQVFVDRKTNVLELANPNFYKEWKLKMGQ